jgi:hypothetical protein
VVPSAKLDPEQVSACSAFVPGAQDPAHVRGRVCSRGSPAPSVTWRPPQVITHVLTALLTNDEPFPDHGCAVAIRFSSARNIVSKFTGRQLGDFLRQGAYRAMVMDCNKCRALPPPSPKRPRAPATVRCALTSRWHRPPASSSWAQWGQAPPTLAGSKPMPRTF